VGVAAQLPTDLGTALLASARDAFTTGLQVTAALSAAVATGIAVLATLMLRDVRSASQAAPEERPAIAAEPVTIAQPEEPIQLIRTGGGCVACTPAEQMTSDNQGAKATTTSS
jgi:hypothetical protein